MSPGTHPFGRRRVITYNTFMGLFEEVFIQPAHSMACILL